MEDSLDIKLSLRGIRKGDKAISHKLEADCFPKRVRFPIALRSRNECGRGMKSKLLNHG